MSSQKDRTGYSQFMYEQMTPEEKEVHDKSIAQLETAWQGFQDRFPTNPVFLKMYATRLSGAEKKKITNPDGIIEETDWTEDDVRALEESAEDRWDDRVRGELFRELTTSLDYQEHVFRTTENPTLQNLRSQSAQNVAFMTTLLERIAGSNRPIVDTYGFDHGEITYEAEAAEVVRRTILRARYTVLSRGFEGQAPISSIPSYTEGDEFKVDRKRARRVGAWYYFEKGDERDWDPWPNEPDEYYDGEKAQAEAFASLEATTDEKWAKIVKTETRYCLEYIKEAAKRSFSRSELVAPIQQMKSFKQLLPWIKREFGQDATYGTLLEGLHPEGN